MQAVTRKAIMGAMAERTAKFREQEALYIERKPEQAPKKVKEPEVDKEKEAEELKAKVKKAVGEFCRRNGLDPVLGKGGSMWLKMGAYRAVGIEPKKYGWVVSINNRLFDDVEDYTTCQLTYPEEGEWFWSKNTLTKNMWKVKSQEALFNFLNQ